MNIILGKNTTPMAGDGIKVEDGELTQAMFDSIDWTGMEVKIHLTTGVQVFVIGVGERQLHIELKKRHNGPYIVMESENLIDQSGLFKDALKKVKITNFGGEYIQEKKEYWMPVDISYESKSGVTNGVNLFTAWYKFNTREWVFK